MLGQTALDPDDSDCGEESMSVSTQPLERDEESSKIGAVAEVERLLEHWGVGHLSKGLL